MKDRIAFSPKGSRGSDKFEINFKKSPQKYVTYDSPQQPQDLHFRNTQAYAPPFKEFDNIKKISDEASSLRQTMNSKVSDRLFRRNILQEEEEKPNKFNDFLRQTMSYKTTKAYSEKYQPDSTNSREVYYKGEEMSESYKGPRNPEPYRITESKSALNLLESSRSFKDYEKLNEKIDRNKKMIEELRKTANNNEQNYLKNVNHNKSPSYLDLDKEKELDDKGFKKKKKQQPMYYLTPKLDKGNYETRFNSSPLIESSKSHEDTTKPESVVSSLTSISSSKKKSSVADKNVKGNLIDEFQMGRKLGQGKFGCVNFVKHKKTSGVFALKKIPKALIKSHMMIQQLALQIRLQSCLNHRNTLAMYGFFDDKTHLYIVLEYMDGGTLYQQLKKGKLTEKDTAVVIKQITEAIDYLHDLGIAHRDLKPQNIVISNNVYKLCDFGWAAMCNQRRKTYCGTFDYVAPQILQGVEYDMTVDLWCLGVMTYELMTGKAPFYHISRKQTMKKILNVENENIIYPQTMSDTAKDFIDKLIRKNPAQRIKASEALQHPFLLNADQD